MFQRGRTNICVRTGHFSGTFRKMELFGQKMDRSGHIHQPEPSETFTFLSQLFKTKLLRLVSAFQDIYFKFYSILKFALGEMGHFRHIIGPVRAHTLVRALQDYYIPISTFQDESFKTSLSFLGHLVPILQHIEICIGRSGSFWAYWGGPGPSIDPTPPRLLHSYLNFSRRNY